MEEQPLSLEQTDYFLDIVEDALDEFDFVQVDILFLQEEQILLDYFVGGDACQL